MSKQTDKTALAEYRAAIRAAWAPIVGRKDLSSAEYVLTEEWFAARVSVESILQAIRQVSERAAKNSTTIYSLGVIQADLAAIRRAQASIKIGLRPSEQDDWRSQWEEELESVAADSSDPEMAAECRELIRDLPGLSKAEAHDRWQEIINDQPSRRNSL